LYRPHQKFFSTGSWKDMANWQALLEPYYDQAERMLGVEVNKFFSPADEALKKASDNLGFGNTFQMAPLGIHFGEAGKTVADPYFGGAGPSRTGCTNCGECMTGCRHGAKNTLVKNYLYLAEKIGTEIMPLTKVVNIEQVSSGYKLTLIRSDRLFANKQELIVPEVVVAAGALGSAKLLHSVRAKGNLLGISSKLGELSRTNSE